MTTLLSIKEAAQYTYDAAETVLKDTGIKVVDVHAKAGQMDTPIGLLMWFGEEHPEWTFLRSLTELWQHECRRFVLLVPDHIKTRPWNDLPPVQRGAIASLFVESNVGCGEFIAAIPKNPPASTPPWVEHHIQRTINAHALQNKLLNPFGHASKNDLSNQFLAPARLLLRQTVAAIDTATSTGWKDIWSTFKKEVLTPIKEDSAKAAYGDLGLEITAAAAPITAAFEGGTPLSDLDLERMMALLTECRVLSGTHTAPDKCESHPPADKSSAFSIMVVDDHAASWRPVFERLKNDLLQYFGRVEFDYSLDGKTRDTGGSIHWGHYDLVILDVFVGRDDGREILNRLRKDYGQLPVLLWTTSRDDEITSKASLANGVLLKKTVTPEVLCQTIGKWIAAGSARKSFSLPNPFFDHVITKTQYRKLANQCNEWCLTQLDSFHALDGAYFRYFSDHGGRHIVKVLELLQRALTPFLTDTSALLSNHPEERQFEIFSLYLGVLCHELGMFPLRQGVRNVGSYPNVPNVEDFSTLGWDYLDDVRSLHALRGLVLLEVAPGASTSPRSPSNASFWSDAKGEELGLEMRGKGFTHPGNSKLLIADAVAVLVGYHARCLKSLKREVFLNWDAAWKEPKDVRDRFGKLRSPVATLSKTQGVFELSVNHLSEKVGKEPYRDRLRKQCALLRFVDSIDVCQSRNPAQFLILGKGRNAKNNVEYLKRQVSQEISIQTSEESAFVMATLNAPTPEHELVEQALRSLNHDYQLTDEARAFVFAPWKQTATDSIRELQKDFDKWLEKTWQAIMGEPVDAEFVSALKEMGVFEKQGMRISFQGKWLIAMITALSVTGEILDEYGAIEDAELAGQIRLGEPRFTGYPKDCDAPEPLTILREGVAQYGSGR